VPGESRATHIDGSTSFVSNELDVVRLLGDAQDLVSILGSDDET
jgi:hypothetical protein